VWLPQRMLAGSLHAGLLQCACELGPCRRHPGVVWRSGTALRTAAMLSGPMVPDAGPAPGPARPQAAPLGEFGAPGAMPPPAAGSEPAGGGGASGGGSGGGGWFSWGGGGGGGGGGDGGRQADKKDERKATELSDPYAAPAPPQFR